MSSADLAVDSAAWVCVRSNVGSCASSFSSRVARWARSSSSSEDGAAVFCSAVSAIGVSYNSEDTHDLAVDRPVRVVCAEHVL